MLNLDTHTLVFALNGELRPSEQALLARNRWSVAAIVLWELAKLVDLGRVDMDLDARDISRALNRIHIWPLDLAVARASIRLDFEGDPADQLIAASLGIEMDDFDYAPFTQHGGVGKVYQVFGKGLNEIMDELNEVLAA